jgi:hypothetical protein
VGSDEMAAGAVTTEKIVDGAVTQAKLGLDVSLEPPDGSITAGHLADQFGWEWHDAVATKHNQVGWATAVDYSGSGVLLLVDAYGGAYKINNRLKITIDGVVWKEYSGIAHQVGASGWNILDNQSDENGGAITLVPFKKFSSSLKVEVYNAHSSHESEVRVNYLTQP